MPSSISAPSSYRPGVRQSFYVWVAVAIAAIVFIGFARTYYLKALFDTPVLTWLVHLHGFLMTLWFGLFFLQSYLIASHRVALHRRLGVLGVILAVLIVVVGVKTAFPFI